MKENSFGNGIKAVLTVIEKFKPVEDESELDLKVQELIDLVHCMNHSVYHHHIETGINFNKALAAASFPTVSEKDIDILNRVQYVKYLEEEFDKELPNYKKLIVNINYFKSIPDKNKAFKQAITQVGKSECAMIENSRVNKMIKGITK